MCQGRDSVLGCSHLDAASLVKPHKLQNQETLFADDLSLVAHLSNSEIACRLIAARIIPKTNRVPLLSFSRAAEGRIMGSRQGQRYG